MKLILLASLALAAIALVLAATAPAMSSRGASAPASPAKKRCHKVKKRVHGHVRRVRVCTGKRHPHKPPPPPPPPPASDKVVGTLNLGSGDGNSIASVAAGDGSVWVTLGDGHRILRVDPATMKVVATIPNPLTTEWAPGVAVGLGSAWLSEAIAVPNSAAGALVRIDEHTNSLSAPIPVGRSPQAMAFAGGSVWTANHRADQDLGTPAPHTFSVSRVDPATNRETARVVVEHRANSDAWQNFCCGAQGITSGAGSVWAADTTTHTVNRIDPATNAVVASVAAPPPGADLAGSDACGDLAGSDSAIWVASGCDQSALWRIDPSKNAVAGLVRLPGVSMSVAVGLGFVWATSGRYPDGSGIEALLRIDPATNSIIRETPVPGAGAVTVGDGAIWVAGGGTLYKVEPS